MNSSAAIHWDPYNPNYFENPYPTFARLREEAPVYFNEEYGFYAVSRYEDVQRALGDAETFSSGRGDILEFIKANMPIPPGLFIMMDPPVHTSYRSALTKVFTPKKMNALEPQIRDFCAKSLDHLVEGGEFNFIEDLGMDMPMRVIGMLLGVPESDLKMVQADANAKLETETGKPLDLTGHSFVGEGFEEYIKWRAKNPSDDLMTELLNVDFTDATGTVRRFTHEEIAIICTIFAGAGNETTNRLIGWTGKVLAENPDQRRMIYENRKLIPQAIEELLRFEPPGPSVARYVTKDTEFQGVKVPAGSALCILVAAANRDPRKFPEADKFDVNRERLPHMTFGYGFHACIGNALARIEGRVALDEILNRFPEWDVDLSSAKLSSTSTVRGWETLPAYTPYAKRGARAAAAAGAASAGPAVIPGAESWNIVMQTPMGPQDMVAHIVRDGRSFTGRMDSPMGSEEIKGGEIAGDTLKWVMSVKKPTPIKIEFEAKIEGAQMTGTAKLGMFGKQKIAGTRA